MVVHYNPLTKEPYLQLPAPCANIVITPHREHQIEETAATATAILNDPRVYKWLQGPPYPFRPEHAYDWIENQLIAHKALVSTLQKEFEVSADQSQSENPDGQEKQEFFGQCPFVCIREVTERDPETGAPLRDAMIGDIGLVRYSFYEMKPHSPERALALEQNNNLPPGHKDIVWGIGDYLSPTHHGRGIMSLAVRTIVQDWGAPRMNVRLLKSSYYLGNIGSSRVFEKNNFEIVCTLKDWVQGNPKKGQGIMSIVVMEWKGFF